MAVAAWRCPQEKWYLAARNATDQTSRFDITKKDMMTMHWVWENRGILMHFGLLFVLLKATKTYQKYFDISLLVQRPIRCTRHLPHCCPARMQLLWHFNEKHTLLKIPKKHPKHIGVSYAVLFKWPFWAIQMNKCRPFINKNAFFGLEWLKQMKVQKYYKLQTCTDAHRNIR